MNRRFYSTRRMFCQVCGVLLLLAIALPAAAQPQPAGHLIPIGGGYSDIYAGFVMQAIANGLLDTFAPGDAVQPAVADVKAAPTRAPTPTLPTNTPAPVPTAPPTSTPTPAPATPTPVPTLTPTAPAATEPAPAPAAAPASTSPGLPILPIAIGAGVVFFLVVLVAGRRRK